MNGKLRVVLQCAAMMAALFAIKTPIALYNSCIFPYGHGQPTEDGACYTPLFGYDWAEYDAVLLLILIVLSYLYLRRELPRLTAGFVSTAMPVLFFVIQFKILLSV